MRKGTCVIVFAVLLLAAGCGGYGGGSKSGSNATTVTLGEQNSSGESGTATLTKVGDKTKVAVDLQGVSSMTAAQPATNRSTTKTITHVPFRISLRHSELGQDRFSSERLRSPTP